MGIVPDDWEIVMGVDLAVGIDQQNDETSYCLLAWNRDTQERQIIYQWTGKVKAEELIENPSQYNNPPKQSLNQGNVTNVYNISDSVIEEISEACAQ